MCKLPVFNHCDQVAIPSQLPIFLIYHWLPAWEKVRNNHKSSYIHLFIGLCNLKSNNTQGSVYNNNTEPGLQPR